MGLRKLINSLTKQADNTLPAIRKSTEAVEVGPEVLGKANKASKVVEEIPDAIFEEITPTTGMKDMSFLGRMDPRLAKLIGAGGAAIGGAALLSEEDEELPPVQTPSPKLPEVNEPEKILPDNYNELAQQEALDQTIVPEKPLSERMVSSSPMQEKEDLKYTQAMLGAQDLTNQNNFINNMLRAGIMGGAAIAGPGAKADYSGVDALDKTAGAPVTDVKAMMDTVSSERKIQQAKREMDDQQKLRDANSDISKTARDIAKNLGINVSESTSAKQLQDAGLPLGTLLSTKMAADSRKEMALLAKEQKDAKKEQDLSQKQRAFAQGLRKELTSGVLGKQYATYSTGQRMSDALQKFAEDPTGYSDYATLMGGLKVLQGDESVVREAEVRMGMKATSLFDGLMNDLQRLQSGRSLQPNQRQAMINTIQTLTDLSKQQYMQAAAPILEQAEMEGIPSSVLLSGSLSGAREGSKPSESQALTTGTVTIRRKSDGATKIMPADKASKMDPEKYEIVK